MKTENPSTSLSTARELAAAGRFAEALRMLEGVGHAHRRPADVLRGELLVMTGRQGPARTLVESLLKSRELASSERSACEFALGRLDWEAGDSDSAIHHLQRSIRFAKEAGDLERLCWSQLRLALIIADRSGPDAAAPLVSELRSNATKLGDRRVVAAVHIFIGEMEAKRGLLQGARRHIRIGREMLSTAPNLWLEALVDNVQLGISVMLLDFDGVLQRGQRVLDMTEESGALSSRRSCLANLGNLMYLMGEFDKAVEYFNRAITALPSTGSHTNACLDSLAQVRLMQGRLEECDQLLQRVEQSIQSPGDRTLYFHRYPLLTRTQLLSRQHRVREALDHVDLLLKLTAESHDHRLNILALLMKAELLAYTHRLPESLAILDKVVDSLGHYPPDLGAHYERVLACAFRVDGNDSAALFHLERAKRVYETLGNVAGQLELSWSWDNASQARVQCATLRERPPVGISAGRESSISALGIVQSVATLLLHAGHPELVAREFLHLLADTACVEKATAISRGPGGEIELLATTGDPSSSEPQPEAAKRVIIGLGTTREVEILLEPRKDIESLATLNAARILLTTVRDLERARVEREERLTLWPIDDVPIDDGQAVVSGKMRGLMEIVRRIASTNVSVLVTGESGTGKEILARAIHGLSDRARKPFVPFNCTAVPREVLESHLFGHRRGSFTGADRDHPGLIRTARDGTLFLDEIGELSLDLQPKLLRFLESGEISPLGEAPLRVDVRIIAATNSDLEQLVKDQRFREDLFYRLNVIRLPVPPLRERRDEIPGLVQYFVQRAAEECRKGQIRIAEDTMQLLLVYSWPGNVRQLQNELRRMIALADPDSVLTPAHLSSDVANARPSPERRASGSEVTVPLHGKLLPTLSRIEREMIRHALHEHGGKVDAAAKDLGISRKGLYLKRQRLDL
jgi:DNA-binding NtrC family response regulator/tetratricopeptide (TPR) repeat protein